MTDDAKSNLISARGELHRVTRALKQFLRWQRASGAIGSTPAPDAERAAFEAARKAREEAKLARLKRGLRADKAPSSATKAASHSPDSSAQVAENTDNKFSGSSSPVQNKAPDIRGSSKSTPWKTLGTRPTSRFGAARATDDSSQPTPPAAAASNSHASSAQTRDDSPDYDESYESYAMDLSDAEPPPYYDPGEPLYSAPPGKDPSQMSKQEKLEFLRGYMGDCRRCGLCDSRSHVVFGTGNPDARLVFVGGAPDAADDQKGEPFGDDLIAGDPGGLLAKMVAAMGLSLDDVYLCTVVKCRPPGDRPPQPAEVIECAPFLYKQLSVVEPEVVVALGGFATAVLTQQAQSFEPAAQKSIEEIRGRWHSWRGTPVMPTFHPRDLLQSSGQKQRQQKGAAWQDLQSVMSKLGLR
jgi:DNA polymerase